MKYDIFISYRRVNSEGQIEGRDIARLIMKELKLYGMNVFFDYTEIRDNDFVDAILPAIRSCKIFILILTPDALTRCKNEGDWVKREILEAHRLKKKIITVNPNEEFDDFPDDLPEELRFLSNIQMSVVDMNSNFEVTLKKMFHDRIQTILPYSRYKQAELVEEDKIRILIGDKVFDIPSEFMNNEVYKALKRAYQ